MKERKKIYLCLIAIIILLYIGLLAILYYSESTDSNAMIRTFGDAFWYSIVTMTTVGYGDLIPVTPLGHVVGMIFLLLSAMTCQKIVFFRFNLSFDLSWKVMKDILTEHIGVLDFATGSPRETLQTAFSTGIINDDIWLKIIRTRTKLAHDYDSLLTVDEFEK